MQFQAFLPLRTLLLGFFALALFSACEDEILPDVGSIPDETPPAASFSASADEADFLTINFTNTSVSATDYSWDFGDGSTSTERNPSHTYAEVGDYTVSLLASDKLNQMDETSNTVTVAEPINNFEPEIFNPGFDIEGDDSYRNGWRNGDLGGVIQITSSPVHAGEKAAKFPSGGDRIAYQLVTVERDTEYTLGFYYTLKTDNTGTITVDVLAGAVTNPDDLAGATIASFTGDDQTSASTYVQGSVVFNSGDNTEVAVYVSNAGVEARIDSFTIVEN